MNNEQEVKKPNVATMTRKEFLKYKRGFRSKQVFASNLKRLKTTPQQKNKAKAARKRRRAGRVAKVLVLLCLAVTVGACSSLEAEMYLPATEITVGRILDKDRAFFSNQKRDLRITYKTPEGAKVKIEATSSKDAADGHNKATRSIIEAAVAAGIKGAIGK